MSMITKHEQAVGRLDAELEALQDQIINAFVTLAPAHSAGEKDGYTFE
mgnify:CR=1 FL=1